MVDAPDQREDEPEPEPKATSKAAEKTPAPKKEAAPPVDNFHNDPLIQDALEIFKGKLK